MKEQRAVAARLVDAARRLGAVASEVLLTSKASLSRGGALPGDRPRETVAAHVRAYDAEGRTAARGGEFATWEEVEQAMVEAVAAVAAASPDPSAGPPERLDVPTRGLSVLDPRLSRLDDEARQEVIDFNLDGFRSVAPWAREVRFSYLEEHVQRVYASSRHVEAVEEGSRFVLNGSARGEGSRTGVRGTIASRHFSDVASRPLGVDLGRRLDLMRAAAALPTAPCPLVFGPVAAAALLPALVAAFQADLVAEGQSYLADRVGSRIASDLFHLIDDASVPGALETRAFDERGVPPVPVPLVREGVATALYRSAAGARRENLRPTGHERTDGSLWSGNLVVRPGNRSRNMIFPLIGTFVIIEDLEGPPRFDPKTGRLDLRAHAFLADAHAVHGFVGILDLRTSSDELLGGIRHMLSDHERHGAVDTPSWVVEGPWFS